MKKAPLGELSLMEILALEQGQHQNLSLKLLSNILL